MSAGRERSSRRRKWLLAASASVVVGGLVCVAVLALGSAFDHWNGWEISITNGCGDDLYADDGADGLPILDGQTISWDRAARSGDKTLTLWRSLSDRVSGIEGHVVNLHGDSVLTGRQCP